MAPRLRATVGIALAQLRYHRRRAVLAVVGVALAVVLVVVLAGLGYGLFTTGHSAIDWINYDLWVSGGPIALAPGSVGGVENPIHDAHAVSRDIEAQPGVRAAHPLAFQSVYVSPNTTAFDSAIGVGVGSGPRGAPSDERFTIPDTHYANGSYDGPMVHEVVISPALAERYGVGVNDTLHIGGTLEIAREHEFRVVAITERFSTFLGGPTVAMPLSELQELTSTTGTDPASLIAVTLESGASHDRVANGIETAHPTLRVRTNQEQVQAVIGRQPGIVAGAVALVGLAVVAGTAIVVNVLAMWVYQQRRELAALRASGISSRTLGTLVLVEGVAVGAVGGLLGVAVTPVVVTGINRVAADLSGFPELIKLPAWLLVGGLGLALIMGVLGASVATWRVTRLSPLAHLED